MPACPHNSHAGVPVVPAAAGDEKRGAHTHLVVGVLRACAPPLGAALRGQLPVDVAHGLHAVDDAQQHQEEVRQEVADLQARHRHHGQQCAEPIKRQNATTHGAQAHG